MATTTGKGYLIRRLEEAPTVECVCGESTRLPSLLQLAIRRTIVIASWRV